MSSTPTRCHYSSQTSVPGGPFSERILAVESYKSNESRLHRLWRLVSILHVTRVSVMMRRSRAKPLATAATKTHGWRPNSMKPVPLCWCCPLSTVARLMSSRVLFSRGHCSSDWRRVTTGGREKGRIRINLFIKDDILYCNINHLQGVYHPSSGHDR